jgi:glycosyltransferase involved in cell wall biosynthesis
MRTVLFDMTPLDTPSRYRGFGRYVRELALGLSKLANSDKQGLRILGLTRLRWNGAYELTEDLGSFEGNADISNPVAADHYREAYKRRVALWRAARHVQADVVHLGDPQATPLARHLAGCKFLVTCHDLIPLRFPERYFSYRDGWGVVGKRLERRRYTSADHVVAISDATRDDLVRFFDLPTERITRVYNGIDLDRWRRKLPEQDRAARVARHGMGDKRYLLYVGDADWRKNVEGMTGGLAHARQRGADVELVIAGALGEARSRKVDDLAREHGVSAWVHRIGHTDDDDLLALFQSAVAHIFVSRAEGFGLPVVESMACGCPVITTRATSLAEVAGDAAWLVEPEDHRAIGEAIVAMALSEQVRADFIARGIERAKLFSNERQASEMLALYRRLAFMTGR